MKKLIYIIPLFLIFAFAYPAVAANNGVGAQVGTQIQQQDRVQDPTLHEEVTTPSGNQVKNVNQVSTQNMGESSRLMVATSEMEQLMDKMSETSGIGTQVRAIAQDQVKAQADIQTQLNKIQSKSSLAKTLFGPNYRAIKSLEAQMEQNRLRIQALTELQNEVVNQADETQLETAIQALIDQNTSLEEQIAAEQGTRSLLGWLIRLFSS